MTFKLPKKPGAVFWPVGTGDSTTLVLKPDSIIMQIDLHHMEKADDPDEPSWPVIDWLVKTLPKIGGKPYLAVFALTHPDQDHCRGFAELLKKVHIGELWHTPKIFRDLDGEESVCEDAQAFRDEADRRRKAILKNPGNVLSGNRLRVIGHDDVLTDEKYKGIPNSMKSRPGHLVTVADGAELIGTFSAFIHAPFSDDQAANKNNTSLSMNISLYDGGKRGRFFFFGDREYPTLKRIFDVTEASGKNTEHLWYDVMLCSHHCSKGAMYWKDEGGDVAKLKQDILDYFEKYARPGAHIVSSSHADFTSGDGDSPPHKKARTRYEEIVDAGGFLCTHEFPAKDKPVPIVFTVDQHGTKLVDSRTAASAAAGLATATTVARGTTPPPTMQVGFGLKHK